MSFSPSALERIRGSVGVWTTTHESLPAARSGDVARAVEAAGFSTLWIAEAWGREAFTSAQLLLSATTTLSVGTGIANIFARDAVACANATRTLASAFDDRFILGLGVSHEPLVERMRGHEYTSPLTRMSDYLDALDSAPSFTPEGSSRPTRLIAALGPKMLALGATKADGVLPYLTTPEHTAAARSSIGSAFLAVEQAVVLGGTDAQYRERAHAYLELYTGLENYRNSWRRMGFDDTDFVRGGSDRLKSAMVIHGDEAAILAGVNRHLAAGADHVCVQFLGADLHTPPYDEWERVGRAIATHEN
jgi:probable F420-dependent oxidoreductase